MNSPDAAFDSLSRELQESLARLEALLSDAKSDAVTLAIRDLLLDHQLATRALITEAEERLGAFDGADHPRALAARAEALIEHVEALQEGWEDRVNLLLELGYRTDAPTAFLKGAGENQANTELLELFFQQLPAEMDQTVEALEYARRFLLDLLGTVPTRPATRPSPSAPPPGAHRKPAGRRRESVRRRP